jgi:prephenate dehydrogenase
MTTVGFIGSGRIGSTVARLGVAAGHPAVLSNSRGPETLQDLAAKLGPLATAAIGAQAAAAGNLVVVAIPLRAYRSVPVARFPARWSSTPTTTTRSATGSARTWTPSGSRAASCSNGTCRSPWS